ncbi:MAG: YkgJ family cysteine cluster protein [candidate division KSB1 bacterium]|nr:YkgJ family cysteine cluster protein [candidate division KSB1 bacterium]MDZ7317957.1 YkgJ family cysteine cluster protein [candidate division KSB1 bacterium]MDZ7342149.1 YkgJ family cysteine cluster protein [candidate division KSB1 bacterium]
MLNEILFEYQNLVYKVDSRCQELEQRHRQHLVCQPGCSQCCEVERTVLAIEAYVVEQRLRSLSPERIKRLRKLYRNNDDVCPLLLRDRCVIYTARPIICRTHGLPILYREAARSFVDYCRLNFTKLPETHIFPASDILDMNDFNVELIQLDKKFAEYVLRTRWRPDQRRSLKSILFEFDASPRSRRTRRR